MPSNLPISRLINVAVNLNPQAAQAQSLSSLLILGTSTIIDVVTRKRTYSTLAAVAADFGTSAEEYLAAALWFAQAPQPTSIQIGRWAKTAAAGQLYCAPRSIAQQALSVWNAITDGAFKVQIDGGSLQSLIGLNFSAVTNMNGVASVINAVLTGATVAWNATLGCFIFTSATTGASSVVSFLTAGAGGHTDISGTLGGLVSSSGAYQSNGIVAESAVACVTNFDNLFSQQWYAVVIPSAVDADHQAVAAFIEATTTKHVYGVNTQEAGVLVAGDTADIAYLLKTSGYKKTVVQYSSSSAYAVCSLLGRILTTDYTQNNSTITLMYKQEPSVTAELLSTTQIDALEAKNCNVFVAYNNNTAIIEKGVMSSGDYVDEILGVDWLCTAIQTALFNVLYTSTTKIPQTDAGQHILDTTVAAVCSQAVTNGLIGPGTWTSGGFGSLSTGDYMPTGFYVYSAPLAQQNSAARAARKSSPIQAAAKMAGAIHQVDILVNVNP